MSEEGPSTESLQVVVRVRPLISREIGQPLSVRTDEDRNEIEIVGGSHHVKCKYDKVFGPDAQQDDIFEVLKPTLTAVAQGYNCTGACPCPR